jgi:hypothetical protein
MTHTKLRGMGAKTRSSGLSKFCASLLGLMLVPCVAHAHGQQFLAPLAGAIYGLPLFVVVALVLPARVNIKLWCIATYVVCVPMAWLLTVGLLTRENANLIALAGGAIPFAAGLVPWFTARTRQP